MVVRATCTGISRTRRFHFVQISNKETMRKQEKHFNRGVHSKWSRCRPISCLLSVEPFSFECRKVIGFAISTLRDWLKNLAPLFQPIRSKTKTNRNSLAPVSRALRQLHVITTSFDWFIVIYMDLVIG